MSVKLYSGSATLYFSEKVSQYFGQPLGNINITTFSDGEKRVSFEESIRGDRVFLIQSTFVPADNILELLFMIDAAKRASAAYVTAVIPYFGYARQDRKDRSRVAIGSKVLANLLVAAGVDRVVTMDLHAPQIQGFFDVPLDHLDAAAVFVPYIEQMIRESKLKNPVFVSPDVGSIGRTRRVAMHFGAGLALCDKDRVKENEIRGVSLIGDVEGRDVVILDDICDTAGSLVKGAEVIHSSGANSIHAFCTHPVLSGQAYERLESSVIDQLVVSDTIPLRRASDKIKVLSVAPLFAQAIHNVQQNKSINNLFLLRGQ